MFKIEDIKAGYLLACSDMADGRKFNMTVIPARSCFPSAKDGVLACCNKGMDWLPLSSFGSDLTHGGRYRVDEVYGYTSPMRLMDNVTTDRELLWQRDDTKRMTLEEIVKALGHKVKIVKAGDPDPNLFKKSNMYAGMVVQMRGGLKYLVVPSDEGLLLVGDPVPVFTSQALFDRIKTYTPVYPLSDYLDGLVQESGAGQKDSDIVRIWDRIPGRDHVEEARTTSTEHRRLVWKRDDTKRMTLEEIAKALGHKVKIVEIVNK